MDLAFAGGLAGRIPALPEWSFPSEIIFLNDQAPGHENNRVPNLPMPGLPRPPARLDDHFRIVDMQYFAVTPYGHGILDFQPSDPHSLNLNGIRDFNQ